MSGFEDNTHFRLYCEEISYDELGLVLKRICQAMSKNHKKGKLSPEWMRQRYLLAYYEIENRNKAIKENSA